MLNQSSKIINYLCWSSHVLCFCPMKIFSLHLPSPLSNVLRANNEYAFHSFDIDKIEFGTNNDNNTELEVSSGQMLRGQLSVGHLLSVKDGPKNILKPNHIKYVNLSWSKAMLQICLKATLIQYHQPYPCLNCETTVCISVYMTVLLGKKLGDLLLSASCLAWAFLYKTFHYNHKEKHKYYCRGAKDWYDWVIYKSLKAKFKLSLK